MSRAYRCRPSEILHITEPLVAFYLDRAVFALAGRIQNELDALKNDDRAALKLPIVLNRWGLGAAFADPREYRRKQAEQLKT
jgi:putative ubiquitin-RnfH superfamily antitoxin RatB of RatAB toxin-antitoxin module